MDPAKQADEQAPHTHELGGPGYSVHPEWDNVDRQWIKICDMCGQVIGILF